MRSQHIPFVPPADSTSSDTQTPRQKARLKAKPDLPKLSQNAHYIQKLNEHAVW